MIYTYPLKSGNFYINVPQPLSKEELRNIERLVCKASSTDTTRKEVKDAPVD